jgi:hypothetical protein
MNKLHYYKDIIINFLLSFLFGVRVEGEPINLEYGVQVPYSTCTPDEQPDEFSWYRELRVGSLHGVNQQVYLEG